MSDISAVTSNYSGADLQFVDKASGNVVLSFRQAAGSIPCEGTADALTAHAGGTQGAALQIVAQMSRFTTVGTAADSAKLPASVAGLSLTVTNAAAANSMNVFPQTGDAINALGANAAFALAAGKTATFNCFTAGQWHTILSA